MNDIEAIDILLDTDLYCVGYSTSELRNACDLAISALEKQLSGGWIPFKAEYDRYFKMDILQGKLPEEEQEILVTDGENVWVDTFMRDGIECYFDSGSSLVDKVTAWQPLPSVYKEVENENI